MKPRAKLLTLPLLACAVAVGSHSPGIAQPLRQAIPGYHILGGKEDSQGKGQPSPSAGTTSGGQLRNYRSRKSARAVSTVSAAKSKDARKINSDVLRYYHEGLADEKKGNLNGAILKLNQSVALREYYWRENDRNIPIILEKIAEIYAKQNKRSEAVEVLEKSLSYYSKIYGPGTPERIPSLMLMGRVLQEKNDYTKSFEYFKQAYLLIERSKGKDAPEAMALRLRLARLANKNNCDQVAAEYYQASVDLDSQRLAPAELSSMLEEYSSLLIKLGKETEAKAILAKAHPEKS